MAVRSSLTLVAATLLLAACGQSGPATPPEKADAATTTAPQSPTFDLSAVPVSTAPLPPKPYFAAPTGYRAEDQGDIRAATFPVWIGRGFQMVSGDVHWMRLGPDTGFAYSRTEVRQAFDDAVKEAGGVRVASGQIPQAPVDALPPQLRQDLNDALGDLTNSPTTTYVIRRADRTIWVHTVVSGEVAFLTTVDSAPPAG